MTLLDTLLTDRASRLARGNQVGGGGLTLVLPSAAIESKKAFMRGCNSSMQLTRAADYGVRVMIHLATLPPEARAFLPALAVATNAPESFLSKVLQALSRAKLIESHRGKAGGFVILPRGRRASMYEVIAAIDGPICLNVCLVAGKSCERRAFCPAHPVWAKAQRAMLEVLSAASVEEMATGASADAAPAPLRDGSIQSESAVSL